VICLRNTRSSRNHPQVKPWYSKFGRPSRPSGVAETTNTGNTLLHVPTLHCDRPYEMASSPLPLPFPPTTTSYRAGQYSNLKCVSRLRAILYITAFEIISGVLHFEHETDCVPEPRWMPWAEMQSLSLFLVPVGCLTKRSRVNPLHILRRHLTGGVLISHYIRTLPMMHTEPVSEKLLYFNQLTQLSARENRIECGRPERFKAHNIQSSFHVCA